MKPDSVDQRSYTEQLSGHHLAPLWESLSDKVPAAPNPRCQPCQWRFDEIHPLLMRAGDVISAEEAVRRVLVLENPGLPGEGRLTGALYGGIQLVLPGEVAPCHRHTQSAFRFVLEGEGGSTSVNGERTLMSRGDFVVTPSWEWHDHGNESDRPIIWFDGLDIPIVSLLDATFAEEAGESAQTVSRPDGSSTLCYGSGLVPDQARRADGVSPLLNYRYQQARQSLDALASSAPADPHFGAKMRYINPLTGDWALPTLGATLQRLRPGQTHPYRCSASTVYVVAEGTGTTRIGSTVFDWQENDVFVVPAWSFHHHETADVTVLFSYSDRPIQEKLGLWREDRGEPSR